MRYGEFFRRVNDSIVVLEPKSRRKLLRLVRRYVVAPEIRSVIARMELTGSKDVDEFNFEGIIGDFEKYATDMDGSGEERGK